IAVAVLAPLLAAAASPLRAQTAEPAAPITEFALPAGSRPHVAAPGPDGALWFSMGRGRCEQRNGNRLARPPPRGAAAAHPVPTPNSDPGALVTGPDGALWFGERRANRIGRFAADGGFTEFPVPTTVTQTLPDAYVPGLSCTWDSSSPAEGGIVVGPDRAL